MGTIPDSTMSQRTSSGCLPSHMAVSKKARKMVRQVSLCHKWPLDASFPLKSRCSLTVRGATSSPAQNRGVLGCALTTSVQARD